VISRQQHIGNIPAAHTTTGTTNNRMRKIVLKTLALANAIFFSVLFTSGY